MTKKWSEIKHKTTPEQRAASAERSEALVQKLREHEMRKQLRTARKVLADETRNVGTLSMPKQNNDRGPEQAASQSKAA